MARMSLIQIQEDYIARVRTAHGKVSERTKGQRFARTKRAARKDGIERLEKMGYSPDEAVAIMRDAHEMFLLEATASN